MAPLETSVQAWVRSIISTPTEPKTWYGSIRDKLMTSGLSSSATPVSRLFDHLPRPASVLLVGLDVAGKTSLLREYLSQNSGHDVHTKIPSIGSNVEEVRYGQVCFHAIDVGGGRPAFLHRCEMGLFNACDAVVYVVDAADRDRLVEAREELAAGFRGYKGEDGIRDDVPVLVLANKQGIKVGSERRPEWCYPVLMNGFQGAITAEELEKLLLEKNRENDAGISEFVSVRPWVSFNGMLLSSVDVANISLQHVAGTDALSGDGVLEAFEWLSNVMKGRPAKQDMRELPRDNRFTQAG